MSAHQHIETRSPIRSSWNESRLVMRGPLTDRKIQRYQDKGYYSKEIRDARKELARIRSEKANKRRLQAGGNFILGDDGRLIYSPR